MPKLDGINKPNIIFLPVNGHGMVDGLGRAAATHLRNTEVKNDHISFLHETHFYQQ
jgi:hypothetical protein